MTIIIELTPDEALRVERARNKGINVETMMRGMIAGLPATDSNERIPDLNPGSIWVSDDFDAPLTEEFGERKNQSEYEATKALFAQWRAEAATMTPEEIAEEDEGWEEIMENLKNNRLSLPVPDVSDHD